MTKAAIAIVDDDEAVQDSLQAILEAHGFQTTVHASGRMFFEQLGRKSVDCVILDVNLPEMSGWEILRRLRECDDPPPAILVSGHGGENHGRLARQYGAFCYVEKPLNAATLLEHIDGALRSTDRCDGKD